MTLDETSLLAERVERAALESLHTAASDEVRDRLGLCRETIGTALVSIAVHVPGILVNRAIGLGVEAPDDRRNVSAITSRYAAAGVERYYLHLHPDARPPGLRDSILEHGLERQRGWAKFLRGRDAHLPEPRSDLEVRRVGPGGAARFGQIVARGFGLAEASAPLLASLVHHPAWRLYISFDGEEPAGAAAMFLHDEVAWLDWAATLPGFRRRGSQGLLLRRRIEDAMEAGCRWMMTETGEAAGGDPQHSYKNILRAGFELLHVRENFGPARTGAG